MPFHAENDMTRVFNKYDTDKNGRFHNYPYFYHKFFQSYRDRPSLRYLEIGVLGGQSLQAFREYFSNANKIVGVDIDARCKAYEDPSQQISICIGSQSDKSFLREVDRAHGPFDVILDDGSHQLSDVIASFETLFPLLNNGGMYVVEDTICFRDKLQYFFNLTKAVNHWGKDVGLDHCVDPFKISLRGTSEIDRGVAEVVFSNSSILIFKDVKSNWR